MSGRDFPSAIVQQPRDGPLCRPTSRRKSYMGPLPRPKTPREETPGGLLTVRLAALRDHEEEAAALLAALPQNDQALWATALYAGLRQGELRALDWKNVDLQANVIRVERGYDRKEGFIEIKSYSGQRTVPIASVLREHLIAHKLRSGRSEGLVFPSSLGNP